MAVRKLQRTPAPACLRRFKHGRNQWGELTTSAQYNSEVWQQLEAMQGRFCAYCERGIRANTHTNRPDAHIEHFYRRRDEPGKTFDWHNLFGSCNDKNTCGGHKDNKARHINPELVCKPDSIDPSGFLQFLSDGGVQPKSGLEAEEQKIAQNTIDIFNLNASHLVNIRKPVVMTETGLAQSVFEYLEEFPDDAELQDELQTNLERITAASFTAARLSVWKVPN